MNTTGEAPCPAASAQHATGQGNQPTHHTPKGETDMRTAISTITPTVRTPHDTWVIIRTGTPLGLATSGFRHRSSAAAIAEAHREYGDREGVDWLLGLLRDGHLTWVGSRQGQHDQPPLLVAEQLDLPGPEYHTGQPVQWRATPSHGWIDAEVYHVFGSATVRIRIANGGPAITVSPRQLRPVVHVVIS